ncbi:amino acid adenylation domain-containing protein [Micromonospora zamorensis]|uniref:amino acid adenylation domain-containing protein n=1 Tax=Micromonospora zamorensis TaxID=709883 RepID=UPI0033D91428
MTADHAEAGVIHHWFARHVQERPDAIAVVVGGDQLTYAELDQRANRIAHRLLGLGVGRETPVGVCLPRGIDLLPALLGVLKAGAAYLPLDPAHTAERMAVMVADAQVQVLVTDGDGPSFGVPHVLRCGSDVTALPDTAPDVTVRPGDLAYVMYTSGSTGTPKGVMVEHRNVIQLLAGNRAQMRLGPDDVWSLFASVAFDVSVFEMWGALLHGARLVVVPDAVRRAPDEFYALLVREGVTVLNQTPAAFRRLVHLEDSAGADPRLALRLIVFAGESLTPGMLGSWFERHPHVQELVNMYGITETTVHTTYRRMTPADLARPAASLIGPAFPGGTVRVLGESWAEVPPGEAGEIFVGGPGVTRGYLGRPDLTAERFVPDPGSPVPGARMYRSGDLARVLPDGDVEYLGRRDHQVKIRGYRVELPEVEAAVLAHPGVREAVVVASPDASGTNRLVAYVVGSAGRSELRQHLVTRLPEFMVPGAFVTLDRLPLTDNGKVDRRALPAPDETRPEVGTAYAEPQTDFQRAVAKIWASALSVDRVGLDDDFFELGGHSMLATQVVAAIRDELGVPVTLRMIFDEPDLRSLVEAIEERG